jgi:DNA (cytosine-5)-methyltransferase 1
MTYRGKKYREPSADATVGTVAELFAGVGGFRIGLSRSGWKTVFSNQWEPGTKAQHASDCYVHNFGEEGHSNEDIATLVFDSPKGLRTSVPKTDLLVGGFPCQDYSVAKSLNSSRGLAGKKGVLWWSIRDIVEVNRPKFIFLENVDRLLKSPSSQRGRDFAIMLRTLGELGYLIEWRVVNSAEYGMPQRRIRIFIVAKLITRKADFPKSSAIKEYIERGGVLARALPIAPLDTDVQVIELNETADILSRTFAVGVKKSPFDNAGVYFNGIAYTAKATAKSKSKKYVLGDVLQDDSEVSDEYWIDSSKIKDWIYLKGAKSIERVHKESGAVYKYAEGKMAFPDLETNPSRTILTGEGGSTASRFKHIIQKGDRFRRLTPVELERLNGFPDNWTAKTDGYEISDARRAFFMGNALVVDLIERVGAVLAVDIKDAQPFSNVPTRKNYHDFSRSGI